MADGFGGTYVFAGLEDFAEGRPNDFRFRQAFGAITTSYGVTSLGAFLTDKWSLTPKLTVDLGLRYDVELLPGAVARDTDNFSPRVGLAYHPSPAWVLRAQIFIGGVRPAAWPRTQSRAPRPAHVALQPRPGHRRQPINSAAGGHSGLAAQPQAVEDARLMKQPRQIQYRPFTNPPSTATDIPLI